MKSFKAIELDPVSRQRTGRETLLEAETRQAAIDALLSWLGVSPETARIDPSRTLVHVNSALWTLVGQSQPVAEKDSPSLRRAGAKHKHIR